MRGAIPARVLYAGRRPPARSCGRPLTTSHPRPQPDAEPGSVDRHSLGVERQPGLGTSAGKGSGTCDLWIPGGTVVALEVALELEHVVTASPVLVAPAAASRCLPRGGSHVAGHGVLDGGRRRISGLHPDGVRSGARLPALPVGARPIGRSPRARYGWWYCPSEISMARHAHASAPSTPLFRAERERLVREPGARLSRRGRFGRTLPALPPDPVRDRDRVRRGLAG